MRVAIASTKAFGRSDRDRHRHRHAALAGRSVGGRHRGVSGEVDVGVREHEHVVLGPAEGLHPLTVGRPGLVDVPGHRGRSDEADRGHVRVLQQRVTAELSPCSTVNTPSGRPACCHSSASSSDADGSFSLGLSTKLLPVAMALAHIHNGTITGKLNGVMPATTPSGCRIEYTSTPVAACSENPPLSSCGTPAANSTFSRPRAISPWASDSTLPCSAVIKAASSSRCECSNSRNANRTLERRAKEDCRH